MSTYEHKQSRRKRRSKSKNKPLDKSILIWGGSGLAIMLVGLFLVWNPMRWGVDEITGQGLAIPAVGILIMFAGLGSWAYLLRKTILMNKAWQARTCPCCQSSSLERVRRRPWDKLLSRFLPPLRRYSCGECDWHGNRLDPSRVYG